MHTGSTGKVCRVNWDLEGCIDGRGGCVPVWDWCAGGEES